MIGAFARLQDWKLLSAHAIFCISFFFSCTGINVFRSAYGFEGNTNPTPEYASLGVIYKGGGVIHRNTIPGALGKPREGELRRGEACSWSAIWLLAGGDSSIQAAKRDGEIDFIHFIEYKQEATFGFIHHNFCTVLVGTKAQSKPTITKSISTPNQGSVIEGLKGKEIE
jgi:hypothetical protein